MNQTKHRILHVLNYSLPYISGYCSRAQYILESQQKNGHEVFAVTSLRQEEIIPNAPAEEVINGIKYYRTRPRNGSGKTGFGLLAARSFMRRFEERIMEIAGIVKPTIIHAHSPSLCGLPARRAASRLGIPFVYEVRALWEDAAVDQQRMKKSSWKYRLSRYMETGLFKKSDAVVVLCGALKKEIGKRINNPGKVHVVPNGVDLDRFRPRRKNSELAAELGVKDCMVIGFIGTFFSFEGLDDLARAWDGIADSAGTAKLLLVGYGELMDELQSIKKNSKHGESILLPGRVHHDKVLDYYSLMDIMVYPRRSIRLTELVTPLKPLEAMAMSKAVIASDVGGLKDIADGGRAGLLFKAGDNGDLSDKILGMLHDSSLREEFAQNGHSYVSRERSWNTIIKEYDSIYASISC